MASRRLVAGMLSLLATLVLTSCGDDAGQGTPLQASASSSVSCKSGKAYQHTTLGYHLCFPAGWVARDYTAEPGSGGAVSVVAFGPPSVVPTHVPGSGTFSPPIQLRVVGGSKADVEQNLVEGNPVTKTTVAGIAADRIVIDDAGPANGTIVVVFEHQGNTFEAEEAPGGTYDSAFQLVLSTFAFAST